MGREEENYTFQYQNYVNIEAQQRKQAAGGKSKTFWWSHPVQRKAVSQTILDVDFGFTELEIQYILWFC